MIEIKKLTNLTDLELNKITDWIYDIWYKCDGYSIDEFKCMITNSLLSDKLPLTFGLYLDNNLIGMYQFIYNDFRCRPDIYPWLANLYIDSSYRGMGYGNLLIESAVKNAKENLNFDYLYLATTHTSLYEKYGFTFDSLIDTYDDNNRIQRLYKLNLK